MEIVNLVCYFRQTTGDCHFHVLRSSLQGFLILGPIKKPLNKMNSGNCHSSYRAIKSSCFHPRNSRLVAVLKSLKVITLFLSIRGRILPPWYTNVNSACSINSSASRQIEDPNTAFISKIKVPRRSNISPAALLTITNTAIYHYKIMHYCVPKLRYREYSVFYSLLL